MRRKPDVLRISTHDRVTRRRLAILAAVIAAINFGVLTGASGSPPIVMSGAYTGAGNPSGLARFASWRGASTPVAVDYLGHDHWSDISEPDWLLKRWQPYVSHGGTLVLGVPIVVAQGGTFADGALGAYDSAFRALADRLVSYGEGSTIIRLGWEFNGSWYPWSIEGSGPNDVSAFIADWQRIVSVMRSSPGSNFRFDWSVNLGRSQIAPETAWPGDGYVDYVGLDVYDQGWASGGGPISDPWTRWQTIKSGDDGLNFWLQFALAHGKQLSVPEWGLVNSAAQQGHGGGDDPLFISDMYAWIHRNKVAYECYFNRGSGVITGSRYPKASAEYIRLWGQSSSSSTPTAGSPTPGTGGVRVLRSTTHRHKPHRAAHHRAKHRRHRPRDHR